MNNRIPPPDMVRAINLELCYIKMILDTPDQVEFIEREKCLRTLAKLGITLSGCYTYFRQLTYHNYLSGPEDDLDTGEADCIWKFVITINSIEIYIKVKNEAPDRLKILSFHEAERPIKYRF